MMADVVSPVTFETSLRPGDHELQDLLDWWLRLRGDRQMPSRADFQPDALTRHLGWIHLLNVSHDPLRFDFRLYGSQIAARLGRDATGMELTKALRGSFGADVLRGFEAVVAERRPLRVQSSGAGADKDFIPVSSLLLPFSDDDEVVNMVMVRHVF